MRPRAIGIPRVSQLGDRDRETFSSPKDQCAAMRGLAEEHGWDLTIPEPYEINVSGDALLEDRPQLSRAVVAVQTGTAEIICAAHTERLWWNHEVRGQVLRLVEGAGGEVWSADEGKLSNGTASEEFTGTVRTAADRFTRKQNAEKSKKGVQRRIDDGRVPWRETNLGYLRDAEDHFHPDPAIAPIIEGAFQLRAKDRTIDAVRSHFRENGLDLSYRVVQNLLVNRVYLGEIHFGKNYAPNLKAHKPLVTRAVFDRVQKVRQPRGRPGKSDRLLARQEILYCATCGGRMVVGHSRARKEGQNGWPMYKCPRRAYGDCSARAAISAVKVEEIVVTAVKDALADVEGRASVETNRRDAEELVAKTLATYEATVEEYEDIASDPVIAKKIRNLKAKYDEARARLDQLPQARSVTISGAEDWDSFTLDEKRELIRATIRKVTVHPGRGDDRVVIEPYE